MPAEFAVQLADTPNYLIYLGKIRHVVNVKDEIGRSADRTKSFRGLSDFFLNAGESTELLLVYREQLRLTLSVDRNETTLIRIAMK